MLYLKQIAANTGYNASIPAIIEILKGTTTVLSGIINGNDPKTNAKTEDAATQMNNEINLMMSKLDAIAQTL